jgi:hypothetical protein
LRKTKGLHIGEDHEQARANILAGNKNRCHRYFRHCGLLLDHKLLEMTMNKQTSDKRTELENFCLWLEERGYLDDDWRNEEPKAVDEYLKEKKL